MLQFQQVSKAFPGTPILSEATFQVYAGERVGLVGPNGAGKSTILQLIVDDLAPDSGQIIISRQTLIGHVRQHAEPATADQGLLDYVLHAVPRLSEIEHQITRIEAELHQHTEAERPPLLRRLGELQSQFEGLGGYQLRSDAEAVLTGLGFHPEELQRPFNDYSGGWRMRAELSRSLIARADLLLLDEPTNYLDLPAIEWLRDHLASTAVTYILVSHDRYLLNELTSVTLAIENAAVERYAGNYNYFVRARVQRQEQLQAAKKNQDRKIEQLERFTDRFRAKASKASQVKSREKELARIERIEVSTSNYRGVRMRLPAPTRCGQRVAWLEQAGKSYDGKHWVLNQIDLEVERGEKLAIVGPNGMGKTTLLRLLAGRLDPNGGSRGIGHNVVVGYQAQDFPETLDANLTVWETVRRSAGTLTDSQVRRVLGGFGFSGDSIEKRVGVLSGGEKVRVALCRLLVTAPNFLLLDEPTTHLDIPTRELLQAALADYQGTLCLVSHDVEFIRNTAETILEIGPDGITRFPGNYDYYRQKQAELLTAASQPEPAATEAPAPPPAAAAAPTSAAPTSAADKRAAKRRDAERRQRISRRRQPLEKKIATCEARLETLQKEQTAIFEALADGSLAAAEIVEKQQRLKQITVDTQSTEIDWAWAVDAMDTLLAEES